MLNDIAKDPARSMIVIDPVLTDTAKMADFHLRVRPGTDAWCLAALAAVLVQEKNLCNEAFLTEHVHGADEVRAVLATVPIAEYAERSGVDEELLRAAARRIAGADSVAVFEDLGVQQAPNSTLCSYLNKLLWILTGSFAKPGGQHLHSTFAPLFSLSGVGRSPVTGAPIIAGLVPSNVVPQEILTDHSDRFRAMIVESANPPAHSIADSQNCRAAFESLELLVVVDVAMTETARLAHYVLPAANQFEKPEATFFNFEFPRNEFHLRHPLFFEPTPGTLPEPEIWARLVRALGGVVSDDDLRPLREAAKQGRDAYTQAFFTELAANPALGKVLPFVLYETLGPTLPDGLAGGRLLWGVGAEGRGHLSRRGAPGRARRRQRVVRRDSGRQVGGGDVQCSRVRRRLGADQPRRPQDRTGDPGDARRHSRFGRYTAGTDEPGIPDRAVRRRAARVHRQRHPAGSVLAQA